MGSYSFADLKNYLKLRFGNADSFDSYYGVWVNSAYTQLCTRDIVGKRRIEIPELETITTAATVDGTAYVSVPTDCLVIKEIYDTTNNKHLDWIAWGAYIAKTDRATATAENKPDYWIRSGGRIYLYPTPDAAYTLSISYRKRPAALSGDSDVTILGQEWDDVILEMAHYIGRNWVGEMEKAEFSRKLADEMINNIMDIYNREEKARRESVRPDPSFHSRGYGY
jgi:hypothetical protein